jgi:hypothetical protein
MFFIAAEHARKNGVFVRGTQTAGAGWPRRLFGRLRPAEVRHDAKKQITQKRDATHDEALFVAITS